jgi:hypothetical protein
MCLSLVIITACTSCKQSSPTPPAAPATPQPGDSAKEAAGGAASASFQKWKTSQVVNAFKAAGLEVENPRPMSKPQDYGAAPTIDAEATQFTIPSTGEGGGGGRGHVYSFASEDDLEKMVQYYANASTDNFSWVYVRDNVLVQVDGQLPEEKAKQYEAALGNVR